MPNKQVQNFENLIFKALPMVLSVIGSILLLLVYFFWKDGYMPIIPGLFSENTPVTINFSQIVSEIIPIEMDNFLVFQSFESLPPLVFPWVSILYGAIIWLLFNLGLTLVSTLKKMYFIGAAAFTIFLLTFSGINGLNIGGLSSNYALIGLMTGSLVPVIFISFFSPHWNLWKRLLLIFLVSSATLFSLISFSAIHQPWLWLAEHATFPATILSALFLLHIGHAIISGNAVTLIHLNKGTGIKISWHLIVIFILYFLLLVFTFLSLTGEVNLPFPTIPPIILMLIAGVLGYMVVKLKIEQTEQAFDLPLVGKSFYWAGFAFTTFTWAKAGFSGNQPLFEFFNHLFIYGQLALSLLFFLYLMANFSQVINSGKDIEKVLFIPKFFAYFHMRIGAVMGLVILTVYADAIIGVQLSTASINNEADYYYQSNKPLEASILYENSWMQYRRNQKAKNATAHLHFQLKEPTEAIEHLIESFDYAPSVPNILLLSATLHRQDKVFEALFYLEKGLEIFPDNLYLQNNLALLYSKLNRPQDALESLAKLPTSNEVTQANLLGLQVKHNIALSEETSIQDDLIFKINYLALANKQGNFAPFTLDTDKLPENYHLKTSILRNQWSNKIEGNLADDLALLDSLIAQQQMSYEERNFKETRIIRTMQSGYINESLKYLNGMAQAYPNSAGYYHSLASKILVGQLDFEKAAIDLMVAVERGFENFQSFHLTIMYFGGKQAEAVGINRKFEIPFPLWMEWDETGRLVSNPQTRFWTSVSELHQMLPDQFMVVLEDMEEPLLKAEWALYLMKHKLHWLDASRFDILKKTILSNFPEVWTAEELDAWYAFIHQGQNQLPAKIQEILRPSLGLDRNAYWAPLVWKKIKEEQDELNKYEILQEAIQFNKDPRLWIAYVKQSRKVGLDSYGSNALLTMQGWLSPAQIDRLQMENF